MVIFAPNILNKKLKNSFMNKSRRILMIAAIVVAVTTVLTGCIKEKKVSVTGLTIDKSAIMVYIASSTIVTAYITPLDASDCFIKWTSSNPDVATVEKFGSDILGTAHVAPHAIGETIITGITNDGGFTVTATVIVNPMEIDDDYATGAPGFYFGNTKIDGETVDLDKLITVKYHSRNKIVFSVDEKFSLSRTGDVECSVKVDYITDITKPDKYGPSEFAGDINVTIMGNSYPATIKGVHSASTLDVIIMVENVPDMGDVQLNFKGSRKSTIGGSY